MSAESEKQALTQRLAAVEARGDDLAERMLPLPEEGELFDLFRRHELAGLEVALCLAAVRARLDGQPICTGAELTRALADTSAGRLAALARLREDGRLVARGFLVPELLPAHASEALDTRFRLSQHVFRLVCDAFDEPRPGRPESPQGAYATNAELLGDLRRLSLHYRRRAVRLFHLDPWTGTGLDVTEGSHTLRERASAESQRVLARLDLTHDTARLPLLELAREHALDLDALVILTTVLFQEHLEGVGAVDAVDLVKLISESEGELLRRRATLRPLALKGLLRLEGAYAGKDLTADASLPNATIALMLGETAPIDSDERLDFHAYLERLESSDSFYTDLDDGDFGPF